MDEQRKNSILNRIETGIVYLNIRNNLYSMNMPTKKQRAISELVYRETLEESKYGELITRENAKRYLESKGIWRSQDDDSLEELNKMLEATKIQLYDALFSASKQPALRKKIQSIKNLINKSLVKKFSLDHITLENHAETTRDEFLVATSIEDAYGNPVYTYENWSKADNYILQRFLNFIQSNIISTEEYREMARTEPFRSRWSLYKENAFTTEEHSHEQLTLMMYSRMYDNVHEHPERPNEEVINDDDMLDGWFAKQRKEAEQERKKKEIDSLLDTKTGKNGQGPGETFVVVGNQQEANKIRNINDIGSRMKMRQREAQINKSGKLEEQQLSDVKMDLRTEAMRQMADRFKK